MLVLGGPPQGQTPQGGYPSQQQRGYPQQQRGYPQQQGGYPQQQRGYPQQQRGHQQPGGGHTTVVVQGGGGYHRDSGDGFATGNYL